MYSAVRCNNIMGKLVHDYHRTAVKYNMSMKKLSEKFDVATRVRKIYDLKS